MNKVFMIAPALLSFGPLFMVIFGGKADPLAHLVGVLAALALSLGILGLFMKIIELERKIQSLQTK